MTARTPLKGATMALALLVAASATQAEEIVKEINVTADYSALTDSNAQTYYPDIAADLPPVFNDHDKRLLSCPRP